MSAPPTSGRTVPGVNSVRIHIAQEDGPRRLCSLTFSQSDASVYLFPTVTGGNYIYGRDTFASRHHPHTLELDNFERSTSMAKLSIHQSGQVHVRTAEGGRTRAVYLPHLATIRGDHVASVVADNFDALPIHEKELREDGPKLDIVARPPEGSSSARLLLYLNGAEPTFDCDPQPQIFAALTRTTLHTPLYVGVAVVTQDPLGDGTAPGVTVMAGPAASPHYVFVRCAAPDPDGRGPAVIAS